MGKRIALILIFIFIVGAGEIDVEASKIKFNDSQLSLNEGLEIINGSSYIDIQYYLKALNYPYSFDERNRIIHLTKNNQQYKIYLNENYVESSKGKVTITTSHSNKMNLRQLNNAIGLYTAYDFNQFQILIAEYPISDISKKLEQSWKIPSMTLNRTKQINVPILCYHVISKGEASTLYTPYWKFEEHLKTIKAQGYTTITPKQLYEAYYMNVPLPKKPILITFDDGYYDNYSLAYPLLKKYDMQATIFIIGESTREVSNESIYGGLPRLSWENIQEMRSHITVQNHTYASHYKAVSTEGKQIGVIATRIKLNGKLEDYGQYWIRIANDFKKTEDLMKEKVGYGSYIFSYPYGETSYTVKKVLEEMQIPMGVTVKSGIARRNSDVYALPRIAVSGNWSGRQLLNHIK